MSKVVNAKNAPSPIGPYNQAILSKSGILFVSGQIALDPKTGELINDSIEKETKQVMENLSAILKEANMNFNNVLKCSIFVKDLSNFTQINKVYGSFFENQFPARETVEVSRLPKDVNVEISLIAE